jgi:LacI family transcriptional regulator
MCYVVVAWNRFHEPESQRQESMPQRNPTIRDVAREAGVGLGTASRAVSDSSHIRPETRQRVLEAVERLGFRPSRMAQGLARGKTQTLGVLVPFFTKHYFLEILRAVERSAFSHDYSLIVYNVERREQALAHLDFLDKTRRVDGLVVIALTDRIITEAYAEMPSFPVIGVDTRIEGAPSLLPDHEKGMYLVVRHLAHLGHQRIALIDRHQDPVSGVASQERQRGYMKACQEAGLSVPDAYLLVADYSQKGGHDAARRLLALRDSPTALVCASDMQAIGATRAAQERGLRVGEDISITGYHVVELAQYVGLTTVRVPASDMGTAAVSLLVEILDGHPLEREVVRFSPRLVVRQSSGEVRPDFVP